MGFLDKLNETVGTLKAQVEQSGLLDKVKDAAGGMKDEAPAESMATGPQSVAEGADLADPKWWPTADDVSTIAGVAVGEAERLEAADTFGTRFAGTDSRGTFTFELHCVREASMVAAGGAKEWIDPRAAAHERHHVVDGFGDYAVGAADGDSRFLCYVGAGDALFFIEANSPGVDESKAAEQILRKLLDWPE